MSNAVGTCIEVLTKIRSDCAGAHERYPRLYYAVISGEAVKNGGVAFPQLDDSFLTFEEYLQEHIADGMPYSECVGWKSPRYFFFGNDLTAGLRLFRSTAEILNRTLRHGLNAVRQQPGSKDDNLDGGMLPEHWHLVGENLFEHEWVFWMAYLGRLKEHPLLTPRSSKPHVEATGLEPLGQSNRQVSTDEYLPASHRIIVPTIHGEVGLEVRRTDIALSYNHEQMTTLLWPCRAILHAVKDGTLGDITIFDTSLFYASSLAIDVLVGMVDQRRHVGTDSPLNSDTSESTISAKQRDILEAMNQLGAIDSDNRKNTAEIAEVVEGKGANPESYKQPIAGLVKKKLVVSQRGSGGGCWLSPHGRSRVAKFR